MVGGINSRPNRPTPGSEPSDVAATASATFNVKDKKTSMKRSSIHDIAKGFASIAYSLGDTNDEDEYTKEMEEDIFSAFKIVERKQKKQKG